MDTNVSVGGLDDIYGSASPPALCSVHFDLYSLCTLRCVFLSFSAMLSSTSTYVYIYIYIHISHQTNFTPPLRTLHFPFP